MIVSSPERVRPVLQYRHGWHRKDSKVSSDGHSISWDGFFVPEEKLVSLQSVVGVPAYACRLDGCLTVFDFSASHLCRRQLDKIRTFYEDVF